MSDCQFLVKSSSYAYLDRVIPKNIHTLPWLAWTFYPPPPPCSWTFRNTHSTLHTIQIPQLLTPLPLWNFWLFFRLFGILFWLNKTSNKWENCTFSTTKKILISHNFQPSKQATQVCYKYLIKYTCQSVICKWLAINKNFLFSVQ